MHQVLLSISLAVLFILQVVLLYRHTRQQDAEERLQLRMEQLEHSNSEFRKAIQILIRGLEQEQESAGKELQELKEAVDEMKDGVDERNNAEARMFEGLSSIFNYDVTQARKAVGADAESEE